MNTYLLKKKHLEFTSLLCHTNFQTLKKEKKTMSLTKRGVKSISLGIERIIKRSKVKKFSLTFLEP